MSGNMTIKEIVRKIVEDQEEIYSIPAKVLEVDEDKRTCKVEPLNGDAEMFGVRLQADEESAVGLVNIPTVDSHVVVTFLNKDEGFVSLFTEVDKVLIDCDEITFNGGDNEGLIIIAKLVEKFNNFVQTFNTHIHTTTATIGPSPAPGVIAPTTSGATTISQSDIENTKIKH